MFAERDERSFGVSIKNGYDVGKSQVLTGTLAELEAVNVTPGTGVFLYNDTGVDITYTVNSDVEFPLVDKTGIILFVDNARNIKVKGTGTVKYMVNLFNDPTNVRTPSTN